MSKLPLPLNSLKAVALESVSIYNSREDYEKRTGKPCPEFAINIPVKMWEVPKGSELWSTYQVAVLKDGRPVVETTRLPAAYAASVNIPPGVFPAGSPPLLPELPFPIRTLEADEELVLPMIGAVGEFLVKNKPLWDAYLGQQPNAPGIDRLTSMVGECLSLLRRLLGQ